MAIVRALLFTAGQAVSAVVWCPVSMLARLLPPPAAYRVISCWAKFVARWLRLCCGLRYRVRGLHHLAGAPAVLMAKHQSAWETIVFQDFLPPHTWVLKRELLFIPFFGWGLAAARPVAINRARAAGALAQLLEQGSARLHSGLHVVVFPEGTRMPPGRSGKHNPGGAWLAAKSGADIIPIAHNAGRFWPRRSFTKSPGTITVHIGPRIKTAGRKPRALSEEVRAWMEREMRELETG